MRNKIYASNDPNNARFQKKRTQKFKNKRVENHVNFGLDHYDNPDKKWPHKNVSKNKNGSL